MPQITPLCQNICQDLLRQEMRKGSPSSWVSECQLAENVWSQPTNGNTTGGTAYALS